MCGIVGTVSASGGRNPEELSAALSVLGHRGPDGQATWSDSHCSLGHRRLAIIDLSTDAEEPLPNEDLSMWLNFNGEIYNFRELRSELEGFGHRFRSCTDAEVALHAYEQWGPASVEKLRGMFAYVVWDARERRLFAARDRVGKKPFFYSEGAVFRFASELQGVMTMFETALPIDMEALDSYLTFGYIPAPQTGFLGVRKLPPGHWMTVDVTDAGLRTNVEAYWNLDYGTKENLSEAAAIQRLRTLMSDAVERRLVSDVPLGAFLSGGIDSSIVVGLMAQLSHEPVKTFSIGFEEQPYNELDHARRISKMWETEHHEFVVKPDASEILPLLVRHYGEPYSDSSAIPTYYLSKLTRSHVTVALNGDGGDENFAGYERHWANRMASFMERVPGTAKAAKTLARLIPDSSEAKSSLRKLQRFVHALGFSQAVRYGRWVGYFTDEEKLSLLRPECRAQMSGMSQEWFRSLFEDAIGLDSVDAALSVDVRSYLPYDLLVKADIATMANSLEARSPFLDQEVMAFAARLPSTLKLRGRTSKYILRKAFADLLPKENVARPKMGFAVPVGQWLRGPLKDLLHETLLASDARTSAYLRPDAVRFVVDRHMNGDERSSQVWNLLMLEMWHREVVDKQWLVSA